MKLRLGVAVALTAAVCTLAAQEPSGAFEGQVAVNCTLKKALSSRDAAGSGAWPAINVVGITGSQD